MENKISIKKNLIYNLFLQIFNMAFPLITNMYLSRILGAENLGIVNYFQSILGWIVIVSSLGIPAYGIREIAKARNDEGKMKKIFSELFLLQVFGHLIITALYLTLMRYDSNYLEYRAVYGVFVLGIIFNAFNIDWFFSGIENYKIITVRNIIIKASILILMMFLVKEEKDYLKYSLLLMLSYGFINIWSCVYFNNIHGFQWKNIKCSAHFKSLKIFYLSAIVVGVYTTFDIILLGFFDSLENIAYFYRAKQVLGIVLAATGSLVAVLMPRATYYYHNDKEKYQDLLNNSLNYNYMLTIPTFFGILILSEPINLILGGEEFIKSSFPLMLLSPLVLLNSLGAWGYNQIIIPSKMEKFGTVIQIIMGIISLVVSVVLMPKFGYMGATIAMLAAEGIGPLISFYFLKNRYRIEIKLITDSLHKYIISGIVMALLILSLSLKLNYMILVPTSILLGALIYLVTLYLLNEKNTMAAVNYMKNKIIKN